MIRCGLALRGVLHSPAAAAAVGGIVRAAQLESSCNMMGGVWMLRMCGFAVFVEGRVLVAGDEEWFDVSGRVSVASRRNSRVDILLEEKESR